MWEGDDDSVMIRGGDYETDSGYDVVKIMMPDGQ